MAVLKEGQLVGTDLNAVVHSVKDLAESLRTFNLEIDDCTFVHCSTRSLSSKETTDAQNVYRLIKSQSKNPVLQVTDASLAKKLGMEDGKYYCYYKPSYINGFG